MARREVLFHCGVCGGSFGGSPDDAITEMMVVMEDPRRRLEQMQAGARAIGRVLEEMPQWDGFVARLNRLIEGGEPLPTHKFVCPACRVPKVVGRG